MFITVCVHNSRLYKNGASRVCHCMMYWCTQIDLRREVGGGGQNKKHQAAHTNNITAVTFKLLTITAASAVHFTFFLPCITINHQRKLSTPFARSRSPLAPFEPGCMAILSMKRSHLLRGKRLAYLGLEQYINGAHLDKVNCNHK